jgi:hypothetical protein
MTKMQPYTALWYNKGFSVRISQANGEWLKELLLLVKQQGPLYPCINCGFPFIYGYPCSNCGAVNRWDEAGVLILDE